MLLDDALHHTLMRQVLRMQSWVRAKLVRSRYVSMKAAAVRIQVNPKHINSSGVLMMVFQMILIL